MRGSLVSGKPKEPRIMKTCSIYLWKSPHVEEGLNLIFLYQFMVHPLVPFRTSKILRIFWIRYITVYMVHMVALWRIICCTSTIPGNDQIIMPILYGKSPLMLQARQFGIFYLIGAQLSYFIHSFWYELLFGVWVVVRK